MDLVNLHETPKKGRQGLSAVHVSLSTEPPVNREAGRRGGERRSRRSAGRCDNADVTRRGHDLEVRARQPMLDLPASLLASV